MESIEKGVNVNIVILNDFNYVLLVKNKARWRSFPGKKFFKPSKWGLPNGKKEAGEGETEAAIRETKEETGFSVNLDPNIRIEDNAEDHINVTFLGHIISGKIEIPPEEITDCRWFSIHALPSDMYFSHQQRLQQLLEKLQNIRKVEGA